MPSLNTGNAILSNAITVDGSYRVGIGTSSPSSLLHLSSSGSTAQTITSVGTNVYSSISLTNTTTGYGYDIGFGGSASIAPNSFYVYGGSSTSIKFQISSAGDFNLNGKTYINGTPSITTNYQFFVKRTTDRSIGIGLQGSDLSIEAVNDAISTNVPLRIYANPLSILGGNVLIGTATDLGLSSGGILQVNSPFGMSITNGGQALRFIRSGVNTFQIGQGSVTSQTGLIIADVTAATNPFFLQQGTGNIGIGTTSPDRRFRVASDGSNWITGVFAGAGGSDVVVVGNLSGPTIGGHNSTLTAWAPLLLNPDGGNVGIGTRNPSSPLEVNGDICTVGSGASLSWANRSGSGRFSWYAPNGNFTYLYNLGNIGQFSMASGAYTALSDVNKKKDFEDSTIGLEAILGLKPTLYRMKNADENSDKELGFIAQQVKEFIPQAYMEDGEGEDKFIGLSDRPIIAALVKAIQEQQAQIEELKALINK